MEDKEIHLIIDTMELQDYLFSSLPEFGLVPDADEVELLTDLFFDFLIHKGCILSEDVIEYDAEEEEED